MPAEYSDRQLGEVEQRCHSDQPLLNMTCWESDDGETVQFLVTVRNNASPVPTAPDRTPLGLIRRAIIDACVKYRLDAAHAGRPVAVKHAPLAYRMKRG